ncbi:MAG: aminodeoxychorismate/anthranilate synthase component II [Deltaproteobacteria bacterium]|nr:aminodeoxychorismate/anthranilate synthase component II [Deltaproteobacteria bacterium]MDH4122005.1 aminodeoxychorismate/anthranilate synthase component II [Deltaproteobacteria bacterium]
MILILDNQDSFTWNLAQALGALGARTQVVSSQEMTLEDLAQAAPQGLVLSAGPGRPSQAGLCLQAIARFHPHLPMLGVCLGHQCLGEAFGAELTRAQRPLHGQTVQIRHDNGWLFQGLDSPFTAGRYNSLILSAPPQGWLAAAWDDQGELMAMTHPTLPLAGVQFHPESFLTPQGALIFRNFLARC